MRKIAHIINPVIVSEASDLFVAQPITFETMRMAKKFAEGQVEVALFTAQFTEDRALVPEGFQLTPDLDRSVLDLGNFQKPRKLPLLVDILNRLYAATDAEYFVYTNADISLVPNFYLTVNALIDKRYDAFVINRRTIAAKYQRLTEIPLMIAEVGEKHPGFDCFVFRREAYPRYELGNICLGIPWIDHVFLMNLICCAQNFTVFRKLHLTFHLGDSQIWLKEKYADYYVHNMRAAQKVLVVLEQMHGPLEKNNAFALHRIGIEAAKQLLNNDEGAAEEQLKKIKRRLKKRQEMQQG